MSMNIAIDGPAGAGKSTIAKTGEKAGVCLCGYGSNVPCHGILFLQNGIAPDDEQAIAAARPKG